MLTTRSIAALVCTLTGLAGCASKPPELVAPNVTVAPYDTATREVVWAVVPLRNESGTSAVDVLEVSDKLVGAAAEIRGVRCLPLNRTIETMRALKLASVSSPAQARSLATALGVDGLLVGTITAFDPYTPTLGLSLVLYGRDSERTHVDASQLSTATTERTLKPNKRADGILATASEHLDGKNHQVLMDVRSYAEGRTRQGDSLGWRRYVVAMPLFEEFAANFVVTRIVQEEWIHHGSSALAGSVQNKNENVR